MSRPTSSPARARHSLSWDGRPGEQGGRLPSTVYRLLAQGHHLDVWEKRDGNWKLLHRVVAGDLDRWKKG